MLLTVKNLVASGGASLGKGAFSEGADPQISSNHSPHRKQWGSRAFSAWIVAQKGVSMRSFGVWELLIILLCCSVPLVIGAIGVVVALVLGRKKR
jgi:hypothetical protein